MAARHPRYDCGPGCPVEASLSLIEGKWKGVVLHHLLEEGTLRFAELRRRMPDATPRVLTRQLREMEADGLVARRATAEAGLRVDYAATPLGQSLRPVVGALRDWGNAWLRRKAAAEVPATAEGARG